MSRTSRIFLAVLALGFTTVPAAAVQAASTGTIVKDTSGATVGTVTKVDGQFYIVKTDRHEVRLPASSFRPDKGVLLFAMTRAQLNAVVDQAKAAADARLVVGAIVKGAAGANVGTIAAVDAEFVTLKLNSGTAVRLPRAALAAGQDGLQTGLTAAELEAAVQGAATK